MRRLLVWMALMMSAAVIIAPASAQDVRTPDEICASAPTTAPANRTFSSAEQVLQPGVDYRAIFCTGAGSIYIDLLEELTPVTVNNFVFLAQQGYYNNTTFHRVIADFMAQGGDPEGTGTGGPGYSFEDEPVGLLFFDRPGWLAMANAGANTNGSQFFITTAPAEHLNYQHTIFGEVLEGQPNVEAINLRDPATATEPGTSLNTVVIIEDPASVKTTYVAPPSATRAEVESAFTDIASVVPPDALAIDEATSGVMTTDAYVASLPDNVQEGLTGYLSDHHHQYHAANTIVNTSCDMTSIPFMSISYSLDAYETPADAAAALADPALNDLTISEGFPDSATGETGLNVYAHDSTACDQDARTSLVYWQRGHFVVTAQITLPASTDLPMDKVLTSFVGVSIYEQILAPVLRPEIRTQ